MAESLVVTETGKEFDLKTSRGVSPWVMEWLGILTVVGLKRSAHVKHGALQYEV